MKEIMQMIVVLSVICTACGLALSGIRNMTAARIENQVLLNVQGPKVKRVLEGAQNNLIADRKKITINGKDMLLFIGKKEGKDWAVAYETTGKGFGGDITIMVGYNLANDKLTGIQVIAHKETPGVGARVTEDQFTQRFKGLGIGTKFLPKNEGGAIDAISGATYSSKGVLEAVRKSVDLYPKIKEKLSSKG